MLVAKNDEEKRSILWRIVVSVTTLIIILVVLFFVVKIFTNNPFVGVWNAYDKEVVVEIFEDETILLETTEISSGELVEVKMSYSLNQEDKIVRFTLEEELPKELDAFMEEYVSEFNYSLEGNELILTSIERGDQLIFTKE